MSLVDQLAQAIATFEGFFKSGSLAARNNNPGNLRSWGDRPIVGGYAYFETAAEGWAALRRQIELDISRGHTLSSFLHKYAPAPENPTESYIAFVARRLGISTTVPLAQLAVGTPEPLSTRPSGAPTWPAWAVPVFRPGGTTAPSWLPVAAIGAGGLLLLWSLA